MTTKWDVFSDLFTDYIMEQAYWDFVDYIKVHNETANLFTADELEEFIEWCDVKPHLNMERS